MTRRFELGPVLVALGALALLVGLFLDWYGPISAWAAFELTDLVLAALAIAALVAAVGLLAPDVAYVDRRWLPAIVAVIAVLVAAQLIDPPPAVADATPQLGAWMAFGAAVAMVAGTVLSLGRVSFAVSVEGRETRERVAMVDHRQDTTETAAVTPRADGERRAAE